MLFNFIEDPTIRMIFQLFLAAALGAAVGLEREHVGKAAGLRTFSLVSLGAALFTIISTEGFRAFGEPGVSYDPSRMASQIVVGIGFLGAGLIIFRGFRVEGLTTAAGLWTSAAIGAAVGVGFFLIAVTATILVLIILYLLKRLEPKERVTSGLDHLA